MVSSARCSPALPRALKGLRLAAEEVPRGCDFRGGRRLLLPNNLPDGDRVRGRWTDRGTGQFRSGRGWSRRTRSGAGRPRRGRSGPPRLVLEVLLWPVGRYSEQGVTLHVCCKTLQRRPFRMTWLKVGARRALGAVGGAWRDSATVLLWARCWPVRRGAPGAGGAPGPRSGVIPPLPRAGVREHHAPVGALRHVAIGSNVAQTKRQGAPRTCRCIETCKGGLESRDLLVVREHHAPVGALRHQTPSEGRPSVKSGSTTRRCIETMLMRGLALIMSSQGAPRTCRCIETSWPSWREDHTWRQGAPRTCRCIETGARTNRHALGKRGQGAPRTCRCIETERHHHPNRNQRGQGAPRTCRCIETRM